MSESAIVRHEGSVLDIGMQIAASGYFPKATTAARAITCLIIGRGMGLSDFESMSGLNIINGKPSLSAGLMATLIKRSGRYRYEVIRLDDEGCALHFFEKKEGKWESCGPLATFTKADAAKAGLDRNNPTYAKYPQDMMFARALSRGYRRYAPDAIGGTVYVEGEVIDDDAPEPAAAPAPPGDIDITEHPLVETAKKLFDAEVVSVDGVPVAKPEAQNADAPPDIDI